MADNVAVTPGSGATIATDDVGGIQFQKVKLDAGGNGVSAPVESGAGLPVAPEGINDGFAPFYEPTRDGTTSQMVIDPSGSIATRGMVLTDEGGFRGNFANSSLAVTIGTCTFVNGSTTVTGSGFDQYDLHLGDYVYLTADGATYAIQVDSVSADSLELVSAYAGPGGTGAGSRQYCRNVVGAGGSMAVSGGALTITCGTTATSVFELERDLDYLPLSCSGRFSISQRIANQDIYYGFYDENSGGTARWYYWFRFTGTTNTVVACECGWNPTGAPSGGEIATTTVTLPNGLTSATVNEYRVDVQRDRVVFIVNDIVLLVEKRVVPHPSDFLTTTLRVVNGTTPGSSTSVVCDMMSSANFNVVSVDNPIKTAEIVAVPPNLDRQSYSVAGVIAINTVLLTLDCARYKSFSIHCTSMGTTGVVTPEWSADASNWVTATIFTQAGASATTFNAAGMWIGNVQARYLRLRLSTATTAGTTTIQLDGCAVRQQTFLATQPVSGTVTATGVAGAAAHDAAISGNPVRTAGRAITAAYTTVATGDTADYITTLQGVQIIKQYQIPELEVVVTDRITNSTTAVQIKALAASLKQYVSSVTVKNATLGGATEFQLRTTPVASTTATIASNTLVMSATYNWKVGDLVYVTASTVTGLTAGNYYYILTVSAANLTFSATRGGSTLAISGTTVSATLAKVIVRTGLETAAGTFTIPFANPADTGTGLALEAVTLTAVTGNIDVFVAGYTAP